MAGTCRKNARILNNKSHVAGPKQQESWVNVGHAWFAREVWNSRWDKVEVKMPQKLLSFRKDQRLVATPVLTSPVPLHKLGLRRGP